MMSSNRSSGLRSPAYTRDERWQWTPYRVRTTIHIVTTNYIFHRCPFSTNRVIVWTKLSSTLEHPCSKRVKLARTERLISHLNFFSVPSTFHRSLFTAWLELRESQFATFPGRRARILQLFRIIRRNSQMRIFVCKSDIIAIREQRPRERILARPQLHRRWNSILKEDDFSRGSDRVIHGVAGSKVLNVRALQLTLRGVSTDPIGPVQMPRTIVPVLSSCWQRRMIRYSKLPLSVYRQQIVGLFPPIIRSPKPTTFFQLSPPTCWSSWLLRKRLQWRLFE